MFWVFYTVFGPVKVLPRPARAISAQLDELQKQIDDLSRSRQLSEAATAPLEAELQNLDAKIAAAQKGIDAAVAENKRLELELDQRQTDMAVQYKLLSARIRSYYKRSYLASPFLLFLASDSSGQLIRDLSYRQSAAQKDKQIITDIAAESTEIENTQNSLAFRKAQLESLQAKLDKEAEFFRGEVEKAKNYQRELSAKIADLSARQQQILAEKAGTFQTTVGDVPLADDPAARPDYSPGFSPAFAAFSFGAPHFKGMSQYGAFGRAKSGQSTEDILHAYYGSGIEIKKDYNTGININVQGYGSVDLETYIKRIYEMPSSWGDEGGLEALKAQAVAARSYALAYTRNGTGSICATENCQVYKPQNKGGKWEEAVNATAGWVLVANSQPFSAWYASTSGGYQQSYNANGYSTPGFWDTKSGRGGWTDEAYEKIAASPWFYKGWYRSRSGDACGRSHPWLTQEEMADILNAWIVFQTGSDDRISPQGSCWGGSPYSVGELKDKANSKGGAVTSVSSASVFYSDSGATATVKFSTNKGEISLSGVDFKKVFNLRAPGRISLKSGLYNIEMK
jgi:peptidoglycan hydrolase-like amidase/peptidoglycan hydrolase CwlO-like protein